MAKNKITILEGKTKDKNGHTIVSVNIFGSLIPEEVLKIVSDEEAVVKKIGKVPSSLPGE